MYRRILILGLFLIISACGGGSYEEPPVVSHTISGVGAIGAPASGKTIYIKDTSGTVNEVTADADGYYSFTAEAQFFPLLIWFDDNGEKVYSVAFGDGTVNVNPLTGALVEFAQYEFSGGGEPENVLYDEEDVAAAEEGLIEVFQPLLDLYGVEDYESGFISFADFEANGFNLDDILDDYSIAFSGGNLTVTIRGESDSLISISGSDILSGAQTVPMNSNVVEHMLNGLLEKITFDTIKGENLLASAITQNLNLTSEPGNKADISWLSSDESVISNTGELTIPYAPTDVAMTVTVSKNSISVSKIFNLTSTSEATAEDIQAVADAENALTFDVIRGNNRSTGIIYFPLALPDTGVSGTEISWSDDSDYLGSDGKVTRPVVSEGDQTVTLTATITKGNAATTKDFEVTIISFEKASPFYSGVYTLSLLKSDGTIWSWGENTLYQLGDNTAIEKNAPVQEYTEANNWTMGAFGTSHSIHLKSDGTLWGWGWNTNGQLGNNSITNALYAVQEATTANDWVYVDAGRYVTFAIKSSGALWAWGDNQYGQLGDGSTSDRVVPAVVNIGTEWIAIDAGQYHTVGIKSDGTLWSWGGNSDGQLGDGTNTYSLTPIQESTRATDWVAVSAGDNYTIAIKSNGTLWGWGLNDDGQLGDGTTNSSSVPVQESTRATNWSVAEGKIRFTAAIKADGTLWAWGDNTGGNLGDGTTNDSSDPVQEPTGATDWAYVAIGSGYAAAMKSDGTVWTWGRDTLGILGNGDPIDDVLVPTMIDITY
ncbi:MAG: immunoglobulin-like domain-containing protein [Deferribacterales bacterium]